MKKYDEFISIGSSCCPALSLRKLNLKKETYPFDWVRSNTKIIYNLLKYNKKNYINFSNNDNNIFNNYYISNLYKYTHFNFNSNYVNYYGQHF